MKPRRKQWLAEKLRLTINRESRIRVEVLFIYLLLLKRVVVLSQKVLAVSPGFLLKRTEGMIRGKDGVSVRGSRLSERGRPSVKIFRALKNLFQRMTRL